MTNEKMISMAIKIVEQLDGFSTENADVILQRAKDILREMSIINFHASRLKKMTGEDLPFLLRIDMAISKM